MVKDRRLEIWISEELYWKLEEERVKTRRDDMSEIIEELLRKVLGMQKAKETNFEKVLEECILKEFPNAKGEKHKDLKAVVYLMFTKGVSRREAVKIRAKERGVYSSTVQANITRGFGINTDELDNRLDRILSCLENKIKSDKQTL